MIIGVVSRLERIKGMDLVIPAFAKVKEEHPDVRLIVVGDGSLKERMMEQARELGCEDVVEWTGRLAQEELAEWYQKMDIAVRISAGFGGGMGRMREVCGAVSGAFMILGMVFSTGNPDPESKK